MQDVEYVEPFIWRVAHNALANYYRGKSKNGVGICMEELSEELSSKSNIEDEVIYRDTISQLQRQIAYLSKIQRQVIILYYYDGRKQEEIANFLGIPLGTVKWHLFEAKSEMRKGMKQMKQVQELKFNPIEFSVMGISGSVGSEGDMSHFFKTQLAQNIAYCVYHEPMTINEIADCLGVSPVYIENEAEYLEEYGFLIRKGTKYLTNFIINDLNDKSEQILTLQDEIYKKAVKLITEKLFDELCKLNLANMDGLYYPNQDQNFLFWSLIPYLLSCGKNETGTIKFTEVATIRKDGGQNIAYAKICQIGYQNHKCLMHKWNGPFWNQNDNWVLWQIDSEWSGDRINKNYQQTAPVDLRLLRRFVNNETLSKDEYVMLIEKGYIIKADDNFKLAIVWIQENNIKEQFLGIIQQIRKMYMEDINKLIENYRKEILASQPKQIHNMLAYQLDNLFCADSLFLQYSLHELLESGRISPVTDVQKKSMSVILVGK